MKKGFTLIELLVAIAICGVLAGIGIPMFNSYQDKAKKSALMANCSHAKSFIAGEMLKCEMNPSSSSSDSSSRTISFKNLQTCSSKKFRAGLKGSLQHVN